MLAARGTWHRRTVTPAQASALLLLALLAVLPTAMGRAGFMLIDREVAERIFPLHTHGVPGEQEYVRSYGAPAPFVHPHCHGSPVSSAEHTPEQLAVSNLLFGPFLCGDGAAVPVAPADGFATAHEQPAAVQSASVLPLVPPPQA